MTTTGELKAETKRTRVELRVAISRVESEIAKTRVAMQRIYVRNIRLMAVCMAVWVGSFAVIYKFLG